MRVLYTIADLQTESGGPSRSVVAIASSVAGQGGNLDVSVIALDYGRKASKPMLPKSPVRTILVPCRGILARKLKYSPAFFSTMLTMCRTSPTGQPPRRPTADPSPRSSSLIHDNGLWLPTNHAAAKVARAIDVPLIISPRGMLTAWALKFRGFKKRVAWHLYQRRDLKSANVLHATSRDEADGFRALGLTQPIAIIPNGVQLPTIRPSERSTVPRSPLPALRSALFLSRIHVKKGLLDLVHAWQAVRPKGWRMVVAGGDENGHLAEIKSEVRKYKLEYEFTFVGEVRDDAKWDLYESADLVVLPTKSENFGIVIAEALAAGKPVITTKGAPWEELQTHRCGWWVDPNAEAVAGALREAFNLGAEERSEMGRRGRKLIEDKYTWPVAGRQMFAVYQWMLGLGPKPESILY